MPLKDAVHPVPLPDAKPSRVLIMQTKSAWRGLFAYGVAAWLGVLKLPVALRPWRARHLAVVRGVFSTRCGGGGRGLCGFVLGDRPHH